MVGDASGNTLPEVIDIMEKSKDEASAFTMPATKQHHLSDSASDVGVSGLL